MFSVCHCLPKSHSLSCPSLYHLYQSLFLTSLFPSLLPPPLHLLFPLLPSFSLPFFYFLLPSPEHLLFCNCYVNTGTLRCFLFHPKDLLYLHTFSVCAKENHGGRSSIICGVSSHASQSCRVSSSAGWVPLRSSIFPASASLVCSL